jgi:bisanhydrobacterioruberin hydratase
MPFISIDSKLLLQKKYVEYFFVIFFIVGFAGTITPVSQPLFLKLFPLALLLSLSTILLFHGSKYNLKTIMVLFLIGILGFFIEVAGVNTHLIFGNYRYGHTLGIKLFNTPLLIGLNWVMLSYAGSSISESFPVPVLVKIVFASLIVLCYDIFLEQVAPFLDMWHWGNDAVPAQNYIAWFIIILVFQTFIRITGIKTQNSIALQIVLIQVVFFISLIVFFKLTE